VGALEPERGTQYEAGVKTWISALDAQATFAVYQLERDNIPIPDDNGFTQQAGNQRARGFEADLSMQPSATLRAFLSYAFNDAELTSFSETVRLPVLPPAFTTIDRSGNRPAFAPRHLMNFWVGKDLTRSLGVGGGARYVGAQFVAEDNGFVIDGVLTFDAMISYRIGAGRIRLNLRNITDREYYLRGFGAVSVIPAPPFSAYLGFDYQL
jgi:outer membrane receptor protein involved in Fe transport